MTGRSARPAQALRRPLVLSAVLFALLLGLRAWLQWVGPLPGDRYALAHYSTAHPGLPAWVIHIYVTIAKPWCVVLTLLAAGGLLWVRLGVRAAVGLILAEGSVVANAGLKAIFGATPLWSEAHTGAVNYPSGHTSYAVAVFGYLGWIALRERWPGLFGVSAVVVLGMGPERVLSGAHLFSDVIGGYLLGLAWLILVGAWVSRRVRSARGASATEPVAVADGAV